MTAPGTTVEELALPTLARLRAVEDARPVRRHDDRAAGSRATYGARTLHPRENRLHRLAEEVAHGVPELADAIAGLTDLAEREGDPRLQRYAAMARTRTESVMELVRRLEAGLAEVPEQPRMPAPVDLRAAVAGGADRVPTAGSTGVEVHLPDAPLFVRCHPTALERAVTHVLATALAHADGDAPVAVRVTETARQGAHGTAASGPSTAGALTVTAERSVVPAGELARIVARLSATVAEQPDACARMGVTVDGVTVESGPVHGKATRDGRLVVHVEWPVEPGPLALIPGRRSPSARPRGGS
jgi:signal transduction histidine kinase